MTKKLFDGYKLNKHGYVYFEDTAEAAAGYDECLELVLAHPRWFLDNLDYIKEFQVPWLFYGSKEKCIETKRNYAISCPYKPNLDKGL